jgi:hypothetical protein
MHPSDRFNEDENGTKHSLPVFYTRTPTAFRSCYCKLDITLGSEIHTTIEILWRLKIMIALCFAGSNGLKIGGII